MNKITGKELLDKLSFDMDRSKINSFIQTQNENCNKNLLITGVSGFLGIHFLHNCLLNTLNVNIYCLIRAKDINEATIKLENNYKKYINNDIELLKKVKVLLGDVNLENWGLVDNLPNNLNIVHIAGEISATSTLEKIDSNYKSILNIKNRIFENGYSFTYISTLSVFVSSSYRGDCLEDSLSENVSYIGGYAQSKFIAEKIVETLPDFKIIRLGLLTASTTKFKFPQKDFFNNVIKSLCLIGNSPTIYEEAFVDITPVDLAAENIYKIVNNGKDKYYHIFNDEPLSLSKLLSLLNFNKNLPKNEFMKLLDNLDGISKKLLFAAFFKSDFLKQYGKYYNMDLFQTTNYIFYTNKNILLHNKIILNENWIKEYINSIRNGI